MVHPKKKFCHLVLTLLTFLTCMNMFYKILHVFFALLLIWGEMWGAHTGIKHFCCYIGLCWLNEVLKNVQRIFISLIYPFLLLSKKKHTLIFVSQKSLFSHTMLYDRNFKCAHSLIRKLIWRLHGTRSFATSPQFHILNL